MAFYILTIPDQHIRDEASLFLIRRILSLPEVSLEEAQTDEHLYYLDSSVQTKTKHISILDVRRLKGAFNNKHSGETMLLILNNAHLLGNEAQNSLLKDVEDAPEDTCIVFLTEDRRKLLDTIRSRAVEIDLRQPETLHPSLLVDKEKFIELVYNKQKPANLERIEQFLRLSAGEQFVYVQDLESKNKDKSDVFESFLYDLLSYYERLLQEDTTKRIIHILVAIEDCLRKVQAGVNPRSVLEYIILLTHYG